MALPGPLHPGAEIALRRGEMDETHIAEAIRDGELASPQKYANSWYFAIRITGTGAAYRNQLKEYVWRDSSIYLNDHFLNRCNGLPVIVEHPAGLMLDGEEYHDRNIGTIVLPFIPTATFLESTPKAKPDDVWGVTRVLDESAAHYMRDHDVSTSPAVVFSNPDVNDTIKMEDGKHLLVEGKPSLLDHVAVVDLGTWDLGGAPTGVDNSNSEKDVDMATEEDKKEEMEEEKKEDRKDAAAATEKLDKILAHLDSAHSKMDTLAKRMDAYESAGKRNDGDEEKAEEEEEEAEELKELASKEEEEAQEAREDSNKKRADAKKKDDEDDERADAAGHHLHRRDDESMSAHSRRVDSFARKHRLDSLTCRDDESARDHSCRIDETSPEEFEKMGVPKATESSNDDKRADRDAKRDDARFDSLSADNATIRAEILKLSKKMEDPSDDARSAFADAQARADAVFAQFGEQAPPSLRGEGLVAYQLRLARKLQGHSKTWKDVDLSVMAKDKAGFKVAQESIYADAAMAARAPTDLAPLTLRAVTKRRPGGGEETVFHGDPLATWGPFMSPARAATRINLKSNR